MMIFNVSVLSSNGLKNYTSSGETNREVVDKILKTFKDVEYISIKKRN